MVIKQSIPITKLTGEACRNLFSVVWEKFVKIFGVL